MMITEITDLFKALQDTNLPVEVSEELYCYFLEVLPPLDMGPGFFVFREGYEGEVLRFTENQEQYHCELIHDVLFTEDWKTRVSIRKNGESNKLFKIINVWNDGDDLYDHFIGQETTSISELARRMNVSFQV